MTATGLSALEMALSGELARERPVEAAFPGLDIANQPVRNPIAAVRHLAAAPPIWHFHRSANASKARSSS